MEISEQQLRDLIREALARHLGQTQAGVAAGGAEAERSACRAHVSHGFLTLPTEPDGRCIIEPAARCDQCGYCKSLGH